MKGKIRLLFWGGCFVILVVAIFIQIQYAVKSRIMDKVTNFSVRQEKGIPVKTQSIKQGSYWVKERFSAKKIDATTFDAEVPLELKDRLKKSMKAFSDNCSGQISKIGSSVNYSTGLFPVRIQTKKRCQNDVEIFDVNVSLLNGVFAIPTVSLQRKGREYYVWVVSNEGVALKRRVEVAQKNGKLVYISKGLRNHDNLVVYGAVDLSENAKVYIVKK